MLSPEQLDAAGDAVAAVYAQIEAKMLDRLVETLVNGVDLEQADLTALALLAQTHGADLQAILQEHQQEIDEAARETVETMLEASASDDAARIGSAAQALPQQIEATVQGAALILARDNLQMVEGAKRAFLDASIEAVTRVNAGAMTAERALHSAVRRLERDGIAIITYQDSETGAVTVRNKVDVAVRRHIRTQIAQDGMRMTLDNIENLEVALVEVSSHSGARPEHAKWQGRCYSLKGDVTIDGVRYKDFYRETDYGSVTGLGGANCRHSFGPYRHGAPRAYEPNPKHPSGLSSEQVYEMEQRQRALERRIREAKRGVRGARQVHDKADTIASRAELAKAQDRLKRAQADMRALVSESNAKSKTGKPVLRRHPNREWAGDMPKTKKANASNRKVDDLLKMPGTAAKVKAAGMSKSDVKTAISGEMSKRGGTAADFPYLTAREQQEILAEAIQSGAINTATSEGRRRAQKHADRYYDELRNRDTATVVAAIAELSSMPAPDAERAFRHLLIDEHDLHDERKRFHPDYEIAQSMQRLIDGREPLPHDIVLFKHENAEAMYMADGLTQIEAHKAANRLYNYEQMLKEYLEDSGRA